MRFIKHLLFAAAISVLASSLSLAKVTKHDAARERLTGTVVARSWWVGPATLCGQLQSSLLVRLDSDEPGQAARYVLITCLWWESQSTQFPETLSTVVGHWRFEAQRQERSTTFGRFRWINVLDDDDCSIGVTPNLIWLPGAPMDDLEDDLRLDWYVVYPGDVAPY